MEISITGPFTKGEVLRILKLVRRIERTRPDKTFGVFLNCPEWKEREVVEIMREIFPDKKISSGGPPTVAS